jgi:hypothetical protein
MPHKLFLPAEGLWQGHFDNIDMRQTLMVSLHPVRETDPENGTADRKYRRHHNENHQRPSYRHAMNSSSSKKVEHDHAKQKPVNDQARGMRKGPNERERPARHCRKENSDGRQQHQSLMRGCLATDTNAPSYQDREN